jgi:GH24 family phage-related lysozyme (muramidase)
MATYLEQSMAHLMVFEGSVPWMYLDTVGKVTVGVGLMLPDAAAACALPFLVDETPATEDEISDDFARVATMLPGKVPGIYRVPGGLELSAETIQDKLMTVLQGFDDDLRSYFAAYDAMPDPAKLALLDMIYNLGPAGLFDGYRALMKAVKAGQWTVAAAECRRHGPSAARNAWTRNEFLAAASQVG